MLLGWMGSGLPGGEVAAGGDAAGCESIPLCNMGFVGFAPKAQ